MHLENGMIEFYGKLKDIEKQNPRFLKCHESVVVNIKKISRIEKKAREVTMDNGQKTIASTRMIKILMEKVKNPPETDKKI